MSAPGKIGPRPLIPPEGVDPSDSFEESRMSGDRGLAYFPSNEVGVFINRAYTNIVSGTNWSLGMSSLFNTDSEKAGGLLSLSYNGLMAGFDFTDMVPCLGLGGIYYKYGAGISVGAYTFGGKNIIGVSQGVLPFIAISTFIYILQSALDKVKIEKIVAGAVKNTINNLFDFFVPINRIIDIVDFINYVFSKPSAEKEKINTLTQFQGLISLLRSYNNGNRISRALTKLDDLILSSDDPYVRASLRSAKDEFLSRTSFAIPEQRPENIFDSVKRVEKFNDQYELWLEGNGHKKVLPEDTPPKAEIYRYMEDVLYLSNKLPMVLKSRSDGKKKIHTIIANSAFYLEKPGQFARFMKELSVAYEFFNSKESGLYQFIRSQIRTGSEAVSEMMMEPPVTGPIPDQHKGAQKPLLKPQASDFQAFKAEHAKLQFLMMWCKQMVENGRYFNVRKNYVLWKIRDIDSSKATKKALHIVNDLKINYGENESALKGLINAAKTSAYLPFLGYFIGLEKLDDMTGPAPSEKPERSFKDAFDNFYNLKKYGLAIEEKRLAPVPAPWQKMKNMASRLEDVYVHLLEKAVKKDKGDLIKKAMKSLTGKNSSDMRAFNKFISDSYHTDSLGAAFTTADKIKDTLDEHGLKELSSDALKLRRTIWGLHEEIEGLRRSVQEMERKTLHEMPYIGYDYSTYIKAIVELERKEKEIIDIHLKKVKRSMSDITDASKRIITWSKNSPEGHAKKDVMEKMEMLDKYYMNFQRFSMLAEAALKHVQERRARICTMMHFAVRMGIVDRTSLKTAGVIGIIDFSKNSPQEPKHP